MLDLKAALCIGESFLEKKMTSQPSWIRAVPIANVLALPLNPPTLLLPSIEVSMLLQESG